MKKNTLSFSLILFIGLSFFLWNDIVSTYYRIRFGENFNKKREDSLLCRIDENWRFNYSTNNTALWLPPQKDSLSVVFPDYRGKEQIFRYGKLEFERDSYLVKGWEVFPDSTIDSAIIILEVYFSESNYGKSKYLLVDQKTKTGLEEVEDIFPIENLIESYREKNSR